MAPPNGLTGYLAQKGRPTSPSEGSLEGQPVNTNKELVASRQAAAGLKLSVRDASRRQSRTSTYTNSNTAPLRTRPGADTDRETADMFDATMTTIETEEDDTISYDNNGDLNGAQRNGPNNFQQSVSYSTTATQPLRPATNQAFLENAYMERGGGLGQGIADLSALNVFANLGDVAPPNSTELSALQHLAQEGSLLGAMGGEASRYPNPLAANARLSKTQDRLQSQVQPSNTVPTSRSTVDSSNRMGARSGRFEGPVQQEPYNAEENNHGDDESLTSSMDVTPPRSDNQHLQSSLSATSKRPHEMEDLDYPFENLCHMSFDKLVNEPFSVNDKPQSKDPKAPLDADSLAEKLAQFKHKAQGEQLDLFSQMSLEEWEESGDWFLEQFGLLLINMKKARKDKRALGKQYEDHITKRQEQVQAVSEGLDAEMKAMRDVGRNLTRPRRKRK